MESGVPPSSKPQPRGTPDTPLVEVTRGYQFSAAHRMHNPQFSAAENARLYGRCNNPSGHGHTYRLEVTIRGPVSSGTGWVADGQCLDEAVRTEVVQCFDRTDLNLLITPRDGPTSTAEVLGALIWRILDGALPPGRLWRLRLEETPNNFFELDREGVERLARPIFPTSANRDQKVSLA